MENLEKDMSYVVGEDKESVDAKDNVNSRKIGMVRQRKHLNCIGPNYI